VLDEKGLRRPEFDERSSVRIRLADGQEWAFPKPWLEIHASFVGGRATETCPILTCGPELDALIEAMAGCRDNAALLMGAASLGASILSANYNLSDRDLDQLFAFRAGDPSSSEWVKAVMDVATGETGSRSFRDGNG
jgi:hypothetical protein